MSNCSYSAFTSIKIYFYNKFVEFVLVSNIFYELQQNYDNSIFKSVLSLLQNIVFEGNVRKPMFAFLTHWLVETISFISHVQTIGVSLWSSRSTVHAVEVILVFVQLTLQSFVLNVELFAFLSPSCIFVW